jgi:hypothetical protein
VAATVGRQRAQRYAVNWPVRIRHITGTKWHSGRSVNLSVSGILLETGRRYKIGDRVEVEIDFLAHPDMKTFIRGAGYVVRQDRMARGSAAIQFDADSAHTIGTTTDLDHARPGEPHQIVRDEARPGKILLQNTSRFTNIGVRITVH